MSEGGRVTRICITGGPRTGKTTMSTSLALVNELWQNLHELTGVPWSGPESRPTVRHTDDLMHLGWSEASQAASLWFDEPGPWIIEGVAASRALRKWRDQHPGEPPPVDRVIRLTTPHVPLIKGQAAMAKGEETVWQEIAGWLLGNGVAMDDATVDSVRL